MKPSHGQTVREANEPKSEGGKKLRKKTTKGKEWGGRREKEEKDEKERERRREMR